MPQAESRRGLLHGVLVYGLTGVMRQGVGFFLLPIYTRVLDQAAYGRLDLVIAAAAFISVLTNFRLDAGTTRFFYAAKQKGLSKEFLGGMLSLRFWTVAIPSVLLLALATTGLGYRSQGDNFNLWMLALVGVPFGLVAELLFLYLRLLEWRRVYAFLEIAAALLGGLLSVTFVVGLKWGAEGVLVAQLFSNVFPCIVIVAILRHSMDFRWTPPQVREVFRYGLMLVPGLFIGWCWVYLSRFLLATRLPITDLANFALGMKVLLFMGFVAAAYRMAWEPIAMRLHSEDGYRAKQWYASSFALQAATLLLLTAFLSAVSRPLIAVLAPSSYSKTADLIPFLAISSLLGFMTSSLDIGNQLSLKTWYSSVATFAGVVVIAAITWLGIDRGGLLAASVAMVVGSIVTAVIVFTAAQHNYPIPYSATSLATFGAGITAILVIHTLYMTAVVSPLASEVAIVLAGATASWFTLGREERILVRSIGVAYAVSRK